MVSHLAEPGSERAGMALRDRDFAEAEDVGGDRPAGVLGLLGGAIRPPEYEPRRLAFRERRPARPTETSEDHPLRPRDVAVSADGCMLLAPLDANRRATLPAVARAREQCEPLMDPRQPRLRTRCPAVAFTAPGQGEDEAGKESDYDDAHVRANTPAGDRDLRATLGMSHESATITEALALEGYDGSVAAAPQPARWSRFLTAPILLPTKFGTTHEGTMSSIALPQLPFVSSTTKPRGRP
jgi:hypothetical protein